MELINLQRANGSFGWGPGLQEAAKMTKDEAKNKLVSGSLQMDEDIWVTALAVAILETKYASEKDLWNLVADKARAFLKKSNNLELVQQAKALL